MKARYSSITAQVEERPKYKRVRPKGGLKKVAAMSYGRSTIMTEDEAAVFLLFVKRQDVLYWL